MADLTTADGWTWSRPARPVAVPAPIKPRVSADDGWTWSGRAAVRSITIPSPRMAWEAAPVRKAPSGFLIVAG